MVAVDVNGASEMHAIGIWYKKGCVVLAVTRAGVLERETFRCVLTRLFMFPFSLPDCSKHPGSPHPQTSGGDDSYTCLAC